MKFKFKEVYSWEVIAALKSGANVFVVDKEAEKVIAIKDLVVGAFIAVMKAVERCPDRFLFYSKTTEEGSES